MMSIAPFFLMEQKKRQYFSEVQFCQFYKLEFHAVNLIIKEVYDREEYDLQMRWYQGGTSDKSGPEGAQGSSC